MPGFRIGQVVTSKAGRDAGRSFVVLKIEETRVVLADGDVRKVENAKRKNVRHLIPHEFVSESIQSRIGRGDRVTNAELRRTIETWRRETAGEER
ncbi:MAG: RNA-binding protein [Firmicutes bacterium]|nr:RNA-binding protein [Bacillota bacterium]